jgi:hypothetical protein
MPTTVVCSLFNDAFSVTKTIYIASNERMIPERLIGKDLEGSGRTQISGQCPDIRLQGLKKIAENLRIVGLWAEI